LRDLRLGQRVAFDAVRGMVVNVDETGRKHEALGVDDLFVFCWLEIADFRDAIGGDTKIALAQWLAGYRLRFAH